MATSVSTENVDRHVLSLDRHPSTEWGKAPYFGSLEKESVCPDWSHYTHSETVLSRAKCGFIRRGKVICRRKGA